MAFFGNTRCERCGHALGYLTDLAVLSALAASGSGDWVPLVTPAVMGKLRFVHGLVHPSPVWAPSPAAIA